MAIIAASFHLQPKGVQSAVAYGLNLDGTTDGRATPNSCAHPKFEGLNGEPAVDNQLYRALGCVRVYDGDIRERGGDTPAEQRTRRALNLYLIELFGQASEHEFRDVRFRVSLRPDGTMTGIMGAYRPIENITTEGRCCKSMALVANHDCTSEHKTFVAMADGYQDPVTGQCSMISSAQRVEGIPAFVVH